MAYKEKENDTKTKGEIDIDLILDIGYTGKTKFNLVYPGRNFELETETKEEAEKWVKALNIIKSELEKKSSKKIDRGMSM